MVSDSAKIANNLHILKLCANFSISFFSSIIYENVLVNEMFIVNLRIILLLIINTH